MSSEMQIIVKRLGILLVIVGLLLLIAFPYREIFFQYAERNLSSDNQINPTIKFLVTINYFFLAVGLVGSGVVLRFWGNVIFDSAPVKGFQNTIQSYSIEPFSREPKSNPISNFYVSSLLGLVVFVGYKIGRAYKPLYAEGAFFETFTALAFFIAGIMVGIAALKIRRSHRGVSLAYFVIMLGMIFFALEEVSWGQWIFNWETPSAFPDNFQNETNLHNFLNPIQTPVESMMAVVTLLLVIVAGWSKVEKSVLPALLLPHPSLVGLAFLAAVAHQGELIEELFAIFVLFYGWRAFQISGRNSMG